MAFGKAIFAKALDLAETALGERLRVTTADHAVDHLLLEATDLAGPAEGSHGAAKLVGLGG
ncbi:hypothetical protein D3C84_1069170 [compost metagenome]